MTLIAPSILSADFGRLAEEVKRAEQAGADMIHIDVMDGCFVPNITIGPLIVEAVKKATMLPLDVHLMIIQPEKYIEDFVKAGADILTVHVEACPHLHRTVWQIKESGIRAGVSLNPATSLSSIEEIIHDIDLILIMSVNPGFGGQQFIPSTLDKINRAKKMILSNKLQTVIEVDGGVKLENAKKIVQAGADILVMGSAFFEQKDYKKFMKQLRKELYGN
ncbi:ribulose-phosphate 3-epimerase [Thermodesulfovibrio yellowstonii]|uniref:ribulose-phosphate 3-epimerase n=1 Tax=Thermodesulfovibrio yellowstonii TaxID=28262 RepID=UPI0024B35E94|nr:ribulose-phosphate 3-epimerase [Thermodesulfovibrio yellowstonii]MDI6864615.1 ribulose-phosphate 3-epimerase [Thermodesulfovibrio yellowstonii]